MNMSQDIKMKMVDNNDGNQVRQNAIQNPGIQIIENMNWLSVVSENANQYENGNVVTTPAKGNGNGINDGLAEVPKDENCYDHDIFNMLTHKVQYTHLQTELDHRIVQLGDLKGKSSDTQCASNTLDPVSQKLKDENVSLEFQGKMGNEGCETTYGVSGFGIGEVVLSTFEVLQLLGFFLQMGFIVILATLDGLDVGLLGYVIGKDDCDEDE
ncbi:hypothetical protein Tco_1311432 [Tanacetum coccineum]